MAASSFRFAPPDFEIPAPARWVLRWALGPSPEVAGTPGEGDEVASWARALGLAPRLAHRIGDSGLAGLLGDAAGSLVAERHRALVGAMRVQDLLPVLGEVSAETGRPIVLLKGAALLAAGHAAAGSRRLTDLDALVPAQAAGGIVTGLLSRGFSQAAPDETTHHLPPLAHPELGVVEIHTSVPGISTPDGPPSAEGLVACGRCAPSGEPGVYTPPRSFLRAHAAVHGLAQHGLSPTVYPLLRVVGDLLDLGIESELEEPGGDPSAVGEPWVRITALSARETRAVAHLARELGLGRLPEPAGDAGALLRHAIAGVADPAYHRSLGIAAACRALARGNWRKLARGLVTRKRPGAVISSTGPRLEALHRASTLAVVRAALR